MRLIIIVVFLISINLNLTSQSDDLDISKEPLNSGVYFELGGVGLIYSINVERRISISSESQNLHLAISLGASYLPGNLFGGDNENTFLVPCSVAIGKHNGTKRFEFGAAALLYNDSIRNDVALLGLFRYTNSFPKNPNTEWGITVSPLFFDQSRIQFVPWAGVRIGKRF